jgi:hypothetical protein
MLLSGLRASAVNQHLIYRDLPLYVKRQEPVNGTPALIYCRYSLASCPLIRAGEGKSSPAHILDRQLHTLPDYPPIEKKKQAPVPGSQYLNIRCEFSR